MFACGLTCSEINHRCRSCSNSIHLRVNFMFGLIHLVLPPGLRGLTSKTIWDEDIKIKITTRCLNRGSVCIAYNESGGSIKRVAVSHRISAQWW